MPLAAPATLEDGDCGVNFSARLDALQQRWSWMGLPIAVVYKFFDDQGVYLAALITYYGFLSLFPLLLLAVTFSASCSITTPACRRRSSTRH